MTARWQARKTARSTPERVSLRRSTSRCVALLSSIREILLARCEPPCTPIQTERVEIAHLAIFERRPLERHREENRLLLPFHDLPLMLLLGDPAANRIEYRSTEPGA
jgi:hypothetical protein